MLQIFGKNCVERKRKKIINEISQKRKEREEIEKRKKGKEEEPSRKIWLLSSLDIKILIHLMIKSDKFSILMS